MADYQSQVASRGKISTCFLRFTIKMNFHCVCYGKFKAGTGFRVGYEDPAYFSREYKKMFGAPPQRDIARLRTNHL
jgi:hypothetical protein